MLRKRASLTTRTARVMRLPFVELVAFPILLATAFPVLALLNRLRSSPDSMYLLAIVSVQMALFAWALYTNDINIIIPALVGAKILMPVTIRTGFLFLGFPWFFVTTELLFMLVLLWRSRGSWRGKSASGYEAFCVGAFLLFALVSLLQAYDLRRSLSATVYGIMVPWSFYYIFRSRLHQLDLDRVLKWMCALGIANAFATILLGEGVLSGGFVGYDYPAGVRYLGLQANPIPLAILQNIFLLCSCLLASRKFSPLPLAALALSINVILLAGSRVGTTIALALAASFLVFKASKKTVAALSTALVVYASLTFIAFGILHERSVIATPRTRPARVVDFDRTYLWSEGLSFLTPENVVSGKGLSGSAYWLQSHGSDIPAVHNLFIELGLELGFLGEAFFLALLFIYAIRFIKGSALCSVFFFGLLVAANFHASLMCWIRLRDDGTVSYHNWLPFLLLLALVIAERAGLDRRLERRKAVSTVRTKQLSRCGGRAYRWAKVSGGVSSNGPCVGAFRDL